MSSESLSEVHGSVPTHNKKGWRKILAFLGPAYLVSVGYMDPGNWATDLAGGSEFGYKLLWVLLMSNLMALLLQSLSARLGVVCKLDLAQASKQAYPKWANIPLYILAEIAIAACDLAEIVGMAIGLNLLFDLPLIWGVAITALDTLLLLFLLNKGMRTMELFIISLVSIIGFSFVVEMFIVGPVYGEVVKGMVPSSLSGNALYIAIGIIGATVMPHNLYLHSSLVQTRKIDPSTKSIKNALKFNFIDSAIALNLAFLVNAAILILAAAAFHVNGFYDVAEIQDASKLLENLFGKIAPTFFAIALIAAGQSSTITGTLAGQIVMEGHLKLRIQPWVRRMITRLIAIIPAIITILYFGEEALGRLLVLSQVVLSLQLGFAVIPLIHFNSDRKLMKEHTIKLWVKILAWVCAGIIVFLNIQLVINELQGWLVTAGDNAIYLYTIVIPLILACFALLVYIFIHPFIKPGELKKRLVPHAKGVDFIEGQPISYQHIAIAVDFSDNTQAIIQNAIKLGGKSANYLFVHVVESAAARYLGKNTLDHETQQDVNSLIQYQDKLISLGYNASHELGFGVAATEIAKIVNDQKVDLVIMGAHGHSGIKDLLFGTTVNKLRHKIDTPILIVQ
ncbi:Nramp family divalent metal transporter [Algoriphagus machipongonensis]|uniref:Divalent metal cation transporter MntH n=1 Tax=Algoriphagus machipongonensis TaxID=388413 RepID=A3I3B6_9BACT|nr:Nramp family divalent metal transporter [Algoriphagus machipongonensis]EAZ79142.2 transporter, NRAMP family [Algoriphagus machipongonensis]